MYEVIATIDLKATESAVWDVIINFAEYDRWNPVMKGTSAVLTKRAPFCYVATAAGRSEPVLAELVTIDFGGELSWRRPLRRLSAWWLRSERSLLIVPRGDGQCRVVQTERFAGLVMPFIWWKLKPNVEKAFNEMNEALKIRAESRARTILPPGRPSSKPTKRP